MRVSPVYYTAWTKKGGGFAVIEPTLLIAVASNPSNPNGPAPSTRAVHPWHGNCPDSTAHDQVATPHRYVYVAGSALYLRQFFQ